jgi:hypothetical protein
MAPISFMLAPTSFIMSMRVLTTPIAPSWATAMPETAMAATSPAAASLIIFMLCRFS